MKLAVIGSRTFDDYTLLCNTLDKINEHIELVISGGAKGADSLAERYANDRNIPTLIIKPDWDTYGRSAGYRRNVDIVTNSDAVVAFWNQKSKGTLHSIEIATSQGKPLKVIKFTELPFHFLSLCLPL